MMHCIFAIMGHSVEHDEWLLLSTINVLTASEEGQKLEAAMYSAKTSLQRDAINIVRVVRYTEDIVVGQIQG